MAIREGNRRQMEMLPPSIEQYIPEDAPVRAYDAFVEALNFHELGIATDTTKEGNPSYDPGSMLKLLIYGYSYGVRSSRKLERETHYNLAFIWLMGGLKPDHKTIAEFRRKHTEAIKKTLTQCVRLCLKMGLISGNVLFVDGSKIRGNASIKNSWDERKCRQILEKAEKRIAEALAEAEALDEAEADQSSLTEITTKLEDGLTLKQQVTQVMAELERSGQKNINTVDRDCTRVNNFQGSGAGYNAQMVVDDQEGLIVNCDAVAANNDIGQFSVQIEQAKEVLGKSPGIAVADSGYALTDDLAKIANQQIQVIVPTQRLASGKEISAYDKRNFHYNQEKDSYFCPMNQALPYHSLNRKRNAKTYAIREAQTCSGCPAFGECTTSRRGRKVNRLNEEELRERLEAEYKKAENRAIYKRRQEKVELVFGHIKRNLGVSSFLLRGFKGVRAEISLLSVCFNVRRMISLLGHKSLVDTLKSFQQTSAFLSFSLNP